MEDDTNGTPPERPDSLLPYDLWFEDAQRQVVVTAVAYAAQNGLPGEHHFYISFSTEARGVEIPTRLLAQYPHEMTIVLQHQYWDLKLEDAGQAFSVGLTFGGIPAKLRVPFAAVTGFADPYVQFGLRFTVRAEEAANDETEPPVEPDADTPADAAAPVPGDERPAGEPQVVSLDAFRKRSPTKDI